MGTPNRRCYCAFCRSERVVYRKKHLSLVDALLALSASLLMSFVFWQDLDPRVIVLFVLSLGISELFIVFRWRLSLPCPHCGFDPVVYKRSPEMAAARVKAHLENRRQDPAYIFSARPKLPVIVKKTKTMDRNRSRKGRITDLRA